MRPILAVILLTFSGLQGVELKVVQQVEPRYPPLAQAARVQKPVKLSLKVNPDGTVQDARIVDGHPLLNDAAIQAAKQWKFNTTPFGGSFELTMPFSLTEPATGKITGRVTDPEGRPMAGVRINAILLIYSLGRRAWNQDLVGAVTDKDGTYTISLARAGDYFVVASYQVPTDAPAGSADRLSPKTFYPGTTDGFAAPTVALRIGATAVADIRIPQMDTVRVSGKVIVPALQQPARSPLDIRLMKLDPEFTEEPIAGNSVRLDGQQQNEIPLNLRGVPRGLYQLTATVSTGPPNWAYFGRVAIEVRDQDVENVTLTLQRNTEFKGRVVLQDPSIRLQNVLVGLIAHGSVGGGFFQVGTDGTVRFFNVPEETYNVMMQGDLGNAYVSDLRLGAKSIYADGFLTVGAGATEDLQIVLRSNGGSIDGAVRTNLREGVGGAQVMLVPDPSRRKNPIFYRSVKADASGAFRFTALAPGEYKLFAFEAAPPDGATQNAEFMARYEQRGVRVVVREGAAESGITLSGMPTP